MSNRIILTFVLLATLSVERAAFAQTKYRGVTVGDSITASDVAVLGEYGANVARYWCRPLDIRGTETEEQYFDRIEDCLAKYDALLPVYAANGIASIIALDPPTPIYFREDGIPEQRVFVEPSAQTQFIEGWQRVATHYAQDARVLGFDLMNEPASGNVTAGLMDWPDLAPYLIQIIRGTGATQRIYVQPEFGNPSKIKEVNNICRLMRTIGDRDIYASFHFFEPLRYTHQLDGKIPLPSDRMFDRYEATFKNAVKRSTSCRGIYLGEFGVSIYAPKRDKYVKEIKTFAEKYRMDWTYHSFREADVWSAEIPDARGKTPALNVLRSSFRRNR